MLTYTLVADGTSDECLVPILDWTIATNFPSLAFAGGIATDLPSHRYGLEVRVRAAVQMFPCNLLFVHRDSEGQPADTRYEEIAAATRAVNVKFIAVVPIRMMEAWLLSSDSAIRRAAGNPNGRVAITIPNANLIERLPNPKEMLLSALREAANLGARRRASFDVHARRRRVAECIDDFSYLRQLAAFVRFENELKEIVPQLS